MFTFIDLQYFMPLLTGAMLTIFLCVVSGILGVVIGMIFGIARTSPFRVARWTSAIYINFMRGQPVLIILLFTYYALPLFVPGALFSRGFTAILGLTAYAGAYLAEIIRGSIEAVPKGQTEAAEALGLNYFRKYTYVIVPQAMIIAVPPGVGFLISLVKASSLVSVIGFVDLTMAGRIVSTSNQNPLGTFLLVAAMYFVICYPIALFGRWYERRMA